MGYKKSRNGIIIGSSHFLDEDASYEDQQRVQFTQRRQFIKRVVTLAALGMLPGCDSVAPGTARRIATGFNRFNDALQGWLYNSSRLAPEYPNSMITYPFPFHAYYSRKDLPAIDITNYRLEVLGLVRNEKPWTFSELRALPRISQTTRHIAAEGWSAIGKWSGVRLSDFLLRVGADIKAKYVGFKCADDYYTSIDMASALHPQTILALSFSDKPLPIEHGYPLRLKIPIKLGYKNPKHITAIYVTNTFSGGYWEDRGYNWFAGC